MAIYKNVLIIVLVATLFILETGNVIKFSKLLSQVHSGEPHISREKRADQPGQYEYEVSFELNVKSVETVEYLRTLLNNGSVSLPLRLDSTANLTHIEITTVCSSNASNVLCRCEEDYVWPYDNCTTYQACDEIVNDTCTCIKNMPPGEQYCQPKTGIILYSTITSFTTNPSSSTTYTTLFSTAFTSTTTRATPGQSTSTTFDTTITEAPTTVTTIGPSSSTTFDTTITKAPTTVTSTTPVSTADTNTTITTTATTGQSSSTTFNTTITEAPTTVTSTTPVSTADTYTTITATTNTTLFSTAFTSTTTRATTGQNSSTTFNTTITEASTTVTTPFYIHTIISIEFNATDMKVINLLRDILRNTNYPLEINSYAKISDANITTVCSPSSGSYQCRCEEQYRWPSDQCFLYGSCDNITNDTCGCINAIPFDGNYCQSVDQHDFTASPSTTTPATTTLPSFYYEYIISIELTTQNMSVGTLLRDILQNATYPIFISHSLKISDIILTTVCSPGSGGYQCRCEEQYRWPCDQCFLHGSCDNIINDTCGCIDAIPSSGIYCQSVDEHDFTACPSSTTTPTTTTLPSVDHEYVISIELTTPNMYVVTLLRNILLNATYPIFINNFLNISDINLTTVCSSSNGDYQCRCENLYSWTCDQCSQYGSCGNITKDPCGCINTIPSDGMYCQSIDQHNATCLIPITSLTTLKTTLTSTPVSPTTPVTNNTTPSPTPDTTTPQTTPTVTNTTLTSTPVSLTTPVTNNTTPSPTPDTTTPQTPPTVTNTTLTSTPVSLTTPVTNNTTTSATTDTTTPQTTPRVTNTTKVTPTTPKTTAKTTPDPTTATTKATTPKTTAKTTPDPTTATTSATTKETTDTTKATPTTKATTPKTTPTTPGPSTVPPAVNELQMTIRLGRDYTAELSDQTSSAFITLKNNITTYLLEAYEGLTGFVGVSVTRFRPGSVITDFTIRTSQVNNEELTVANEKLPEVMRPIGPVIGGVTVRYRSTIDIEPPSLTYTGRSMTLRCGPPPESINLGTITAAKWKLNGKEIQNSGRTQIASSGTQSVLTVNNVILADKGLYECNLMGSLLTFVQVGRASNIRQAPNVRVPGKINVKCSEGGTQSLQCCVQRDYTVKWFQGSSTLNSEITNSAESYCILHRYSLSGCGDSPTQELSFTCKVDNPDDFEAKTTIIIFNEDITCRDRLYGNGRPGDISTTACDPGLEGSRTAQCQATGEWILLEDNCILTEIKDLLIDSEDLVEEEIPEFAANLSKVTEDEKQEIVNSSATISAIVGILSTIAAVSTEVEKGVMEDVLQTVDVLISDDARESWEILRENVTRNDSSELLNSLETLSDELVGEFTIRTGLILLNTTTFDDSFSAELNSSVTIDIPNADSTNISITTIIFATLDNVLPPRNSSFNSTLTNDNSTTPSFNNTINAAVALVRVKADIQNVTLSFKKDNNSLTEDPQCVFWNFSLFDNFGAWDDEGCTFVSDINNTVTCNCNHLTSFSILMATDIPEAIRVALDVITYVGVGISIASLLICLIIEGYVWKALTKNSTAFMRHVCIVNTALSLLIADICFIIAASYAKNPLENPGEDYKVPLGPCTAATFFMHFFYLALFFWMLASGLLLLYRTVMVFSHMSKSVMMAIGFLLGYVCPLIIAVVTVAATAPGKGYIRENDACWLNWVKTKALLALVIPALTIVAINFLIVIVIVVKMLRRSVGDAARIEEKHTLAVVFRCVIILTPLFGLTWGLGIGTMVSSTNKGIHIAFAFFNSLQGFFILVFGTLLDAKIRVLLAKKRHVSSSGSGSNQTASTSAGSSSLSGLKWFRKLRGKKHVYRVSDIVNSSSSGGAESFSNI
ncbi:adhesion G protein-coupled receptor F5-like isoform X2 [Corythoichthys intestinalis]|nr:adhesion G protein-coupled receptor F5-like isoform X2 [Corythoichthys intestinalis]